ncbi:probable cholinesterase [Rhynchosporium agropyri]|uniref:Carboxylic ester hydrolase n=1 Tax=Rhynchosporium agropyri TaxID=914238 RepID=A0A1E1K112_9HELO|nr:probable cholinesterase [Rhynchosporium agropyri]
MIGFIVSALALTGAVVSAAPTLAARNDSISKDCSASELPIVDLGYALHQATVNETGNYYNFSNIRFGAAPIGDLRFKASIPPTTINRTLNDGQQGSMCAQASPYWPKIASAFLGGSDAATLANVSSQVEAASAALTVDSLKAPDPRQTEDCLFLDVIVPESIYTSNKSAPVLVWVYGGGYVNGDKSSTGNPATLIAQSQVDEGEGVVYVAMNYRLGLFGWLSGSTFLEQDGVSNAALYDQHLAFEWIQQNIHLFGGDPARVTVMGESAGAGSIMHQITAYGGVNGSAPFSQAIMQSPGFSPIPGDAQQVETYHSVLSQAQALISPDIRDVASLRDLDFKTLAALNSIVVARSSPYGTFSFGPTVDGTFVPKLPGVLLSEGKFDSSVNVMVSHNSNEGLTFTSPFLQSEAAVATNLKAVFQTATNDTISYILNTLYPAVYDGTYPYDSIYSRATLITSEISFTCNTRFLNLAFQNETYAYYFTVPPGLHGEDIQYTFFNGDTTTLNNGLPVQPAIATAMQKYITNFAMSSIGSPNGRGVPFFPQYQDNSTTLVVGLEGVGALVKDTAANERCAWLMEGLYVNK